VTYPIDHDQARAHLRLAHGHETIELGGAKASIIAAGADTAGDFGLFRWDMQPRVGGPSAHTHRTFAEAFLVLGGQVSLYDGSSWHTAGAGDFLYVPANAVHAFANTSDTAASMLILFVPGRPRERYFRELAEMRDAGRHLSETEWREFLARHDQYAVEMPGG
jgi:quercetin dioxygenase-like cupin family protein